LALVLLPRLLLAPVDNTLKRCRYDSTCGIEKRRVGVGMSQYWGQLPQLPLVVLVSYPCTTALRAASLAFEGRLMQAEQEWMLLIKELHHH
jgi:hypothetical protein